MARGLRRHPPHPIFHRPTQIQNGPQTFEFSFTADAVIKREQSGSFTADAVIKTTQLFTDPYSEYAFSLAPTSYWRLGEPSGTLVNDEQNVNDGGYDNAPTLGVTGAISKDLDTAITVNGTNEFVTIGDVLDMGTTGTWAIWFKRARLATAEWFMSKGTDQPNITLWSGDDRLYVSANGPSFITGPVVEDFKWHFVVFVHQGTAAADQILYLDGVQVATGTGGYTAADNTSALRFGIAYDGTSGPFQGSLDEAAVFSTVLTPQQIAHLYDLGRYGVEGDGFTADAVIKREGTGSFTADAVIKRTQTGSFTADAVIHQTIYSGFAPWTALTAAGAALNDVAYGNGYWVRVGNTGLLHYKAGGPVGTWTSNTQGSDTFNAVAYGNGYWVAVGNTGTLYYATDPTGAWTSNAQGSVTFRAVAYGNGYWVAVGDTGTLYYKATDPTSAWTSNAQGTALLIGVAYGNGYWVAVANSGFNSRYKATDPTGAWSSNAQGPSSSTGVAYGNGLWVAVSGSASPRVATDPTGTWTLNPQSGITGTDVVYADGYWAMATSVTTAHARFTDDPSGTWWNSLPGTGGLGYNDIAYNDGYWVLVGATSAAVAYTRTPSIPPFRADAVIVRDVLRPRTNITASRIWRPQPRIAPQVGRKGQFEVSVVEQSGSFTADAITLREQSGTFVVDAITLATQTNSFTADAVIKREATGSFTADAVVRVEQSGTLTADAIIAATVSGSLTADADISARVLTPKFNVNALGIWRPKKRIAPQTKRRSLPHTLTQPQFNRFKWDIYRIGWRPAKRGQVQKMRQGPWTSDVTFGSFTADAVIGILLLDDNFDRVSTGLGTSSDGRATYQLIPGTGTDQTVDGSVVVVSAGTDGPTYVGAPGGLIGGGVTSLLVAFDVRVDSTLGGEGFEIRIPVYLGGALDTFVQVINAHWVAAGEVWGAGHQNTGLTFTGVANGDWWSVKALVSNALAPQVSIKAWKRTDTEPADWQSTGNLSFATIERLPTRIVAWRTSGFTSAFDNLRLITFHSTWVVGHLFTADAVVRKEGTGSFTADAYISQTISGSFTADAVVLRAQTGSYTADAVLKREQTGTFTADAVVKREQTGTFTADAVIRVERTGSFLADAVVLRTQTGSLTADAVLFRTISGSFSADAVIMPTFTADAIVLRTQSGTFTADAVVMPVFRADAIVLRTQTGSFSVDAAIATATSGQVTVDAVIFATVSGSFAADAEIIGPTLGARRPAFRRLQRLLPAAQRKLHPTQFSVEQGGSFTADAIVRVERTDAFTADAVTLRTASASLTADAVLVRTTSSSFSADAVILRTQSASLLADAVLRRVASVSFTADAVILATQTATLTADSVIRREQVGSLAADAIVFRTQSASFTADAIVRTPGFGSFTADAYVLATRTASFTADAVIQATISGAFTADAVLWRTQAGSLVADAVILASRSASLTADAVLSRTSTGAFTADAVIFRTQTATFTADAFINVEGIFTFSADAVIQLVQAASLTADAVIGYVGGTVWVSPPNHADMSNVPVLVFTMPASVGNMHFNIELDKVDTFDGPEYQSIVSHSDLTGWEYWDGALWQPVPQAGVPNTFSGNEARYTVQTPLGAGVWYRRVRTGTF